jgi:hypothetical protein
MGMKRAIRSLREKAFRRESRGSRWARSLAAFGSLPRRLNGRLRRRVVMARMERADIVLASPRTVQLSIVALLYRIFLRAKYVHSMLYLGNGRILHTTARDGVTVHRLPASIFRGDRYAIYRARDLTPVQRNEIVESALKLVDMKLDPVALVTNIPARWFGIPRPLLRLERERQWCSKLIHTAYQENGIPLMSPDRAGSITSEDLSRSPLLDRIHPS